MRFGFGEVGIIWPLGDKLFFTGEGVRFADGPAGDDGEGVVCLLDHLRVLEGKQLLPAALFPTAASIHPREYAVEEFLNGWGELGQRGAWLGRHAN